MGKAIKKEPIMVERSVIDENVKRYKELIPTTDDRFGTNPVSYTHLRAHETV